MIDYEYSQCNVRAYLTFLTTLNHALLSTSNASFRSITLQKKISLKLVTKECIYLIKTFIQHLN